VSTVKCVAIFDEGKQQNKSNDNRCYLVEMFVKCYVFVLIFSFQHTWVLTQCSDF